MDGIISRVLRQRKPPETQVVWGIRVPLTVKNQWSLFGAYLRVPMSLLVPYVLNEWVETNKEILAEPASRDVLAAKIMNSQRPMKRR